MINKLNKNVHNKQLSLYYKLAKDLPVVTAFECSYKEGDPETIELDNYGEEVMQPRYKGRTNDNMETIVKCDGASVDLKDCVDMMLKKIEVVVRQVTCLTIQQALDKIFFLCCADSTKHDALGEKKME